MGMKASRLFITHLVMGILPSTRCFALKRWLLRWCGAQVGENVRIVSSARFYTSGCLFIGDGTWVGHEVLVAGGDADIVIGANVDIAPRVSLLTGSHKLFTTPNRAAGQGYSLSIRVKDGAWLGASSTILGGVTIGECAMIGAGALVNKDAPSRTVFAGIPARAIKCAAREVGA